MKDFAEALPEDFPLDGLAGSVLVSLMSRCESIQVGGLCSINDKETIHAPFSVVFQAIPSDSRNLKYHIRPVELSANYESEQDVVVPRAMNSKHTCLDTLIRFWNWGIRNVATNSP